MITEDQSEVIAFLASPGAHGGVPVVRIDTHASAVFLAGRFAWKLKRAVRYDYLDFSTAERRKAMCEAELRVNRRTAPSLYLAVVAVVRTAQGALSLGGSGTPVDWLVKMARFDEAGLFDRLAAERKLDLALMRQLAGVVAALHREAAPRPDHGGAAGMSWVVAGNVSGLAELSRGVLDPAVCEDLADASLRALERHREQLERRRQAGFVREGHGDLHLRNIVLIEGRPVLFDGIEFNAEIACTDVFYDLAFLLMDLWHRHLPAHANVVLNGYVADTGDLDGLALLPFLLSCRAAVRAKTSATAAGMQSDAVLRRDLESASREYLEMARALLGPPPPLLVAFGGLSGTGKSTMARAIAPAIGPVPGAVLFRTDEIRKELCGVDALTLLGPEGYSPGVTRRVYDALAERASHALSLGHAVIVDAVFARETDRAAVEAVARSAGVPFSGVWLDAPEAALVDRVTRRTHDASDADAVVVRRQLAEKAGGVGWRRIDASGCVDDVLGRVRRGLAEHLRDDQIPAPRVP